MIGTLRTAVVAALLLAAGNAWALGLGKIEVKSRRNQPLVAEIPIVSTTPGELEALQARLASPDTFRRVGLSPPTGVAADLQFSLGSDARGRPVIRVTTIKPVDQSVLNFLIEVDWGQGRLVREYSALIEAPNAASAPLQPAIEAPVAPASNVVERPAAVAPAPPAAPAPKPAPAATQPAPAPASRAIAPAPAPAAAPVAPPAAVPAPAPVAPPSEYGPVQHGQTLSEIASGLGLGDVTLNQAMLALLRANPGAFIGDNVNRLRQGAVLRIPGRDEIRSVGAAEARQVVSQQIRQWRQARQAVLQPAATAAAGDAPAAKQAGESAAPAAVTANAAAKRGEARLEIIPPSAQGKADGTRSGTEAGGEGSMLQQQLQQKDEEIASKSAEIDELKERVAELEKLQQQQQSLLSMKDTELAAAQQRLATTNAAPAKAGDTAQPSQGSAAPWLWGGLGVVVLALLAWAWKRRAGGDKPVPQPPRRSGFDSQSLAASMVPPVRPEDAEPQASPEPASGETAAPPTIDLADVPRTAAKVETPTWHSGWTKTDSAPAPAPAAGGAKPRFLPEDDAGPVMPPSVPQQASVEQRFKLAGAFLDIGDEHSARQLLLELLHDADPAAREDAARMLRELG